jgi:hypothetical protein
MADLTDVCGTVDHPPAFVLEFDEVADALRQRDSVLHGFVNGYI